MFRWKSNALKAYQEAKNWARKRKSFMLMLSVALNQCVFCYTLNFFLSFLITQIAKRVIESATAKVYFLYAYFEFIYEMKSNFISKASHYLNFHRHRVFGNLSLFCFSSFFLQVSQRVWQLMMETIREQMKRNRSMHDHWNCEQFNCVQQWEKEWNRNFR